MVVETLEGTVKEVDAETADESRPGVEVAVDADVEIDDGVGVAAKVLDFVVTDVGVAAECLAEDGVCLLLTLDSISDSWTRGEDAGSRSRLEEAAALAARLANR